MPPSLLSLPNELLAHIVDAALGEYAPRLYQQRQDTARALRFVNKRIGAIVRGKKVEAVEGFCRRAVFPRRTSVLDKCLLRAVNKRRYLLANGEGSTRCDLPTRFWKCCGRQLRDLRLVGFHGLQLEAISQLPVLSTLILERVEVVASQPLVAPHLKQLGLSSCDYSTTLPTAVALVDTPGCPALRAIMYAARSHPDDISQLCSPAVLDQVDFLSVELRAQDGASQDWAFPNLPPRYFSTTLVDLDLLDLGASRGVFQDVQHLRLYYCNSFYRHVDATNLWYYAQRLGDRFPSLQSLYLPRVLDPARLDDDLGLQAAVKALEDACRVLDAEVVFEHEAVTHGQGEDVHSPHFAARCRRLKSERAATKTTAATATEGVGSERG
ncbi:hypothetical protein JCM10450v2_003691 [Rhodotorula kratochvilovae]